jgi:hypothetical protein
MPPNHEAPRNIALSSMTKHITKKRITTERIMTKRITTKVIKRQNV